MAIGAIIGAALALGSSIYGGVKSSNAAQKAKEENEANVRKQLAENQNWYDRKYNEDATQRADAQRILQLTREAIRQRNRAAQGRAAVMGATEEGVAATKQANSDALANAVGQIAAQGEARKDAIENQYQATKAALNNQLATGNAEYEKQRAQAIATATAGAGQAIGNAGMAVDDYLDASNAAGQITNQAGTTTGSSSQGGLYNGAIMDESWKKKYPNIKW